MPNVFIAGVSGYLGSGLAEELIRTKSQADCLGSSERGQLGVVVNRQCSIKALSMPAASEFGDALSFGVVRTRYPAKFRASRRKIIANLQQSGQARAETHCCYLLPTWRQD